MDLLCASAKRGRSDGEAAAEDTGHERSVYRDEDVKRDAADTGRASFTERCSNDSVTLSLVLGCLDVYSILRARRVCRTWQAATRAPLTWSHCSLAVHVEHVARIPASSVALLRHLTVGCNCKGKRYQAHFLAEMTVHPQALFEWVGQLRGLRSLHLGGVFIDVQLCTMLSTYAAGIRELDLTMCIDNMDRGDRNSLYILDPIGTVERHRLKAQSMGPLDSSVANNDAHDAQDGLLSAAATSASRHVKDAMAHMRLPPAADDRPLPVLRLPQLTSLKLPKSSSYRQVLSLIAPLNKLQSLQLQRCGTFSPETAMDERYYLALVNRLFAHTYADTLTHLTLFNLDAHGFESYRFELLHKLTHLSLEQRQQGGNITCAALHAVAALPRLERCEIHMSGWAVRSCSDPEWWHALAGVRSLVALSLRDHDAMSSGYTTMITYLGLEHVMQNSDIRLEKLELVLPYPACLQQVLQLDYPHLHTLVLRSDVCLLSVLWLARMPCLTSLDVVSVPRNLPGTVTLLQALPKLRTFKCDPGVVRLRHTPRARLIDRDVWLALVNMPALTSLHINSARTIPDDLVDAWCGVAASRPPAPDAMRAFMGGAPPDRGSAPQFTLQHLYFSSDTITHDQSRRLLRSMPQLQLLSMHREQDELHRCEARPFCARLICDVLPYS